MRRPGSDRATSSLSSAPRRCVSGSIQIKTRSPGVETTGEKPMNTLICAASMLLAATVSAFGQSASPDVLKDLAPTGKLRAAINLGNGVLAQTGAAGGQPEGITPDLAKELGRRLG